MMTSYRTLAPPTSEAALSMTASAPRNLGLPESVCKSEQVRQSGHKMPYALVHAGCPHTDQHFTIAGCWLLYLPELENVSVPVGVLRYSFHD